MWLRKAALLLASTALSLLAAELVLRDFATWAPLVDMRMYAERDGMVLLKPGFRGRHRTPLWDVEIAIGDGGWRDAAADRAEVLLIGDSFVFGWGVEREETFHAIWEKELGVPVTAFGLPGAGPCEYARLLERLGPAMAPREVVVAFYAGNDFADAEPGCPARFAARDGLLVRADAPAGGVWDWLRRSQLLQTLRAASFSVGGASDREWDDALRRLGEIHMRNPPNRSQAATREAFGQLERIARWCREHRASLRVLVIPRRAQIVRAEQLEWQESLGLAAGELDWKRPQTLLRFWTASEGVELVDAMGEFGERMAAGEELYHHPDAHLNARGHEVLATVLAGAAE